MTAPSMISAPRFRISTDQVSIPLIELKGINSTVEPHEYIYNDDKGKVVHSKNFGKTKPPQVVVVTALDFNTFPKIMAWHQAARSGSDQARKDVHLFIYNTDGSSNPPYTLEGAWLSKVDVTGAKAGQTETVTVTLTLECDAIDAPGGGS